ncbi:MAG: winged helix-turn-helix domain-containing protein [Sphingomicrobium sp.]
MSDRDGRPGATLPGLKRFWLGSALVADPVRHSIIRDGRAIAVEPRVMQLLTYFAARPGEIISKEELREQVWGTNVVDEAVHRAISLLRSALGDTPRQSTIIETVPRHGYRLLITPAVVEEPSARLLKSRGLGLAAVAAGVAVMAILLSPALRWGPAETPPLPVVAPQTPAAALVEAPQGVERERQRSPRVIAAAPRSPETRADTGLDTPARAPQPRATASERRASPGLAPEAPPARTERSGEVPAPRAEAPVAGELDSVPPAF